MRITRARLAVVSAGEPGAWRPRRRFALTQV
jgi:hypothetical protein